MLEMFLFILGVLVGFVLAQLHLYLRSGHGYFKMEPYPEEEDIYTVNVRLLENQNLLKKKRVILKREYMTHDSPK